MSFSHTRSTSEPNHRQQIALERVELATDELGTVLLSACRSKEVAAAAIANVRNSLAPVLTDILTND